MKHDELKRGAPPLPEGQGATSQIQLRVQTRRKAAYVSAANKKSLKLTAWIFDICDRAAGYQTPPAAE